MVKRICVLFSDASLTIVSGQNGEAAALAEARHECAIANKGIRKPEHRAMFGEIEIDFGSFKEKF